MLLKKRITLGATVGTAFLLMGVNMPSCPGQQAMQKQIDDATTADSALQRNLKAEDDRVKGLENEVKELKNSLGEVAEVLKSHKATIEEVEAKVKELSERKPPAKKTSTRRH